MDLNVQLPPASAPAGTMPEIARYLDKAATRLWSLTATDAGLEFRPYAIHLAEEREPEHRTLGHELHGKIRERRYVIQILTNGSWARDDRAIVTGSFVHYVNGVGEWIELVHQEAVGLGGLNPTVSRALRQLRLACVWNLPEVTDPDIKT